MQQSKSTSKELLEATESQLALESVAIGRKLLITFKISEAIRRKLFLSATSPALARSYTTGLRARVHERFNCLGLKERTPLPALSGRNLDAFSLQSLHVGLCTSTLTAQRAFALS